MANVHFGSALRSFTGGVTEVEIEATSVRELVRQLEDRFPGIGEALTAPGLAVAIDGDIIPDAIYEEVPDNAEVHFLTPPSGG